MVQLSVSYALKCGDLHADRIQDQYADHHSLYPGGLCGVCGESPSGKESNLCLRTSGICFVYRFSVDAAVCAQRVREAQWNEFFFENPRDNRHIVLLGKIDRQISGRIVSLTDSEKNDGMIHTWSLFSNENNMNYYFDMGWVKLFYRYGVIPGILYVAACLALLWQFYRKKDACGLVLFVAFAVYTVVEAHLISVYVGRNYLLMMMGCSLFLGNWGKDALEQGGS